MLYELWCWRRLLRIPWLARRSNQSILKEISPEYSLEEKDWCWSWNCNNFATWCEELTDWKRPWCWERQKAGEKGDNGWQDGWMASLTQRTWVWTNSGSWWRTGKSGPLQFMGSQKVGHDSVTEQQHSILSLFTWTASNYITRLKGEPQYCSISPHKATGSRKTKELQGRR